MFFFLSQQADKTQDIKKTKNSNFLSLTQNELIGKVDRQNFHMLSTS